MVQNSAKPRRVYSKKEVYHKVLVWESYNKTHICVLSNFYSTSSNFQEGQLADPDCKSFEHFSKPYFLSWSNVQSNLLWIKLIFDQETWLEQFFFRENKFSLLCPIFISTAEYPSLGSVGSKVCFDVFMTESNQYLLKVHLISVKFRLITEEISRTKFGDIGNQLIS